MSLSVKVLEREDGLKPDAADRTAALLYTLTDLYALKPSHSPEEERQFTELAIRLIDAVDRQTRIVVAQRLERYGRAPLLVMRHLAHDVPASEAAPVPQFPGPVDPFPEEPAFFKAGGDAPAATEPFVPSPEGLAAVERALAASPAEAIADRPEELVLEATAPETAEPAVEPDHDTLAANAAELIELFFTADEGQRKLILQNLDLAPIKPADPLHETHTREAARRLEVAALARNPYEFATILVGTLGITQSLAVRIAQDPSGEPLIVAARALSMPTEILQRIVLFLNPAVGKSVQRVYDLVRLHDEIAPDTARRMLTIWRMASAARRPRHQPILHDDETRRTRAEASMYARSIAPRIERARRPG